MNENGLSKQKRPWRTPEIIEVGTVVDVTEGEKANVGENDNPRTYSLKSAVNPDAEVDLEEK